MSIWAWEGASRPWATSSIRTCRVRKARTSPWPWATARGRLSSFLAYIFAGKPAYPNFTAYQGQLIDFVETQTGETGLTFAQAQTTFEGFSQSQQAALIDNMFYNELLLSGRAANSGSGVGFAEGYAAIDALYPGQPQRHAAPTRTRNLDLITSQIYTLSGGNISHSGARRRHRRGPRLHARRV